MVIVFISVPSYVYAFLVQYFLCFKFDLFPLQLASQATADFFSWKMFHSRHRLWTELLFLSWTSWFTAKKRLF